MSLTRIKKKKKVPLILWKINMNITGLRTNFFLIRVNLIYNA